MTTVVPEAVVTLGAKIVTAFVPLAEMFGYTNDLRSMTQGRASSTMELFNYQEVPAQLLTK